jgi:hypothetical protein
VETLTFGRFKLPKVNEPSCLKAISILDKLKPSGKDNRRTARNLLPNQERPTVQQKEPTVALPEHSTWNLDVGRQPTANRDGMISINIMFYENMRGVPFIVSLNAVTVTN